jgi:uncharacterized protein
MEDMAHKDVIFYSCGLKMAAALFTPDDYKEGEKRAGIILLPGFTANKEMRLPEFAQSFNQAGYVVMTVDYRGFGASEGARGEVRPLERVEDIGNAVTYLALQPMVDPEKIGMIGICFGGGVASYLTAFDKRIKCLAVPGVIANGGTWIRSTRRLYEWAELMERIETDRKGRVVTGESDHVPVLEVVIPDPEVKEKFGMFQKDFKYAGYSPSLACWEAVINFRPEDFADRISPTPYLIFAAAHDTWADSIANALKMYEKAKEPKKLVILPGCTHFGMTEPGPNRDQVIKTMVEWFVHYLPARSNP